MVCKCDIRRKVSYQLSTQCPSLILWNEESLKIQHHRSDDELATNLYTYFSSVAQSH